MLLKTRGNPLRTMIDPSRMKHSYPTVYPLDQTHYRLKDYHAQLLVDSEYWACQPQPRSVIDKNYLLYIKIDAVEYHNLVWADVAGSGLYGYHHRNAANVWHTMKVTVSGATKNYYVNSTLVLSTTKDCMPICSGHTGMRNVWIDTGDGSSGIALPEGFSWY